MPWGTDRTVPSRHRPLVRVALNQVTRSDMRFPTSNPPEFSCPAFAGTLHVLRDSLVGRFDRGQQGRLCVAEAPDFRAARLPDHSWSLGWGVVFIGTAAPTEARLGPASRFPMVIFALSKPTSNVAKS